MKNLILHWSLAAAMVLLMVTACKQPFEGEHESSAAERGADGTSQHQSVEQPSASSDVSETQSAYRLFFLPPLVRPGASERPEFEGAFAADLEPQVRVINAANGDGNPVAEFSTDGRGSERVRVDTNDEHYIVNFHPRRFDAQAGDQLTIEVLVEGDVVGALDVQLVATGAQKRHVDTDTHVPLPASRTVPVRFRIEAEDADPPVSPPPRVRHIDPEAGEGNPVVWPADEDDPVEQTYQLETADSDYDGPLYFRAVAEAELPEWITLDSESGTVVVSTAGLRGGEDGERTVEFYSSANADAADDDEATSTIAEPFPVTFHRERELEPDD